MSHDLNGIWQCDNGGLYYVYHYQNNVWFAGLSDDGQFYNGLRHCSVFAGTMGLDGLIRGRWANVPRGTANNGGNLKLKVNYDSAGNATGFTKIPSGDLGSGSFWFNRSQFGPKAPEIYDVFDKVKKNVPATFGQEKLLDNLKPCKVFPVVIFGKVLSSRFQVNYPLTTGRDYKDFICLRIDDIDGDLQFDIQSSEDLLTDDFWNYGWQNNGVTPENFRAKLQYQNYHFHCETIMYGGTAECHEPEHYDDPRLLPGWQQSSGNSVLINGIPIEGNLEMSPIPPDGYACFVDKINGFSTTFPVPTNVRVTGILVLDCGHKWPTYPCHEEDPEERNEEIHPVLAIDIINPKIKDNLTGVWGDPNGLTYYIRHVGTEVWWLATSPALDCRWASAFYGRISVDQRQIQGALVSLPLGTLFQGIPSSAPRPFTLLVAEDRLKIDIPDGPQLMKLYDWDEGQVDPPDPPTPISEAEVLAKLEELAKVYPVKLNWKVSIVDLLVLLNLESSFKVRQEMAVKLGCPAELMKDSAKMNVFLHRTILKKMAENGGNIPTELLAYSV